jgi:hypothetical protein
VEVGLFLCTESTKFKAFWYDDFARHLNFRVLEALGSARVAIELRIDSDGSSELLAIDRQDKTNGEIWRVCEVRSRYRRSWARATQARSAAGKPGE